GRGRALLAGWRAVASAGRGFPVGDAGGQPDRLVRDRLPRRVVGGTRPAGAVLARLSHRGPVGRPDHLFLADAGMPAAGALAARWHGAGLPRYDAGGGAAAGLAGDAVG